MKKKCLFLFLVTFVWAPVFSSHACPDIYFSGYHTHYAYNPIYVQSGNSNDVKYAFDPWMGAINSVGGPFYYYTSTDWEAPNKVESSGSVGIAQTITARNETYRTILYFTIRYNSSLIWCMGQIIPEYCPNGQPSFWAAMTHEAGHAVGFSDTTLACSCTGFVGSAGWLDAWPTMVGSDNACVNGGFLQPYILLHTLSALDVESVERNYSRVVLVEEPFENANIADNSLELSMSRNSGSLSPAFIFGSLNNNTPQPLGGQSYNTIDESDFYGYRVPLNDTRISYVWYKMTSDNTMRGPFEVTGGNQIPQLAPYSMSVVPNPFNPRTTIKFYIAKPDNIRLDIFDIQGRFITNLSEGFKQAGEYSAVWNGTNDSGQKVSAGTYIVKIKGESRVKTQKFTLLK